MTKSSDILKTDHYRQLNWLDGRLQKNDLSIFLNPDLAIKALEELKYNNLVVEDCEIENFVTRYLSERGIKKLITTLRVAKTRSSQNSILQIALTEPNNNKLNYLFKKTSMSKVEIINKLIEMADLSISKKKEEQLEIILK